MAFKDILAALIDERGGRNPENLSRIADKARAIAPDFSSYYLVLLLEGQRPRNDDLVALAEALEIRQYRLLSGDARRLVEYAAGQRVSDSVAREFRDYIESNASFRNETLEDEDLRRVFYEFMDSRRLEEDFRQFGS